MKELLKGIYDELEIKYDEEQYEKFNTYATLLIEWNKILPISPKISYRFDGDDMPSEFKWNRSNNGTASIYSNDAVNKQSFLNHLSTNKYLFKVTKRRINKWKLEIMH